MNRRLLYVALAALALAVAVPLASNALAQEPTPTPEPTTTSHAQCPGMGAGMMDGGHHGEQGTGSGLLGDWQTIQRVSALLRLTPQDIATRLEGGETPAAIAQAQGVSLTDLVNTILAPFKEQLQVRVKYGYITQEQADFIIWQRTQALETLLQQPIATPTAGATGMMGPGMMAGPQGVAPGASGSGGMMGGGMMGGGMMGGSMMGGTGQAW
ncbi:MAG: hypothetical protein HYX99_01000 [Chloroflexi bacterium]|nr:hypothetical protein [Chloroflexota bacterium]